MRLELKAGFKYKIKIEKRYLRFLFSTLFVIHNASKVAHDNKCKMGILSVFYQDILFHDCGEDDKYWNHVNRNNKLI